MNTTPPEPTEYETTTINQNVLALNLHQNIFGCAYFDSVSTKLRIMHDIAIHDGSELVRLVMEQVSPSIIITCISANEDFVQLLKELAPSNSTRTRLDIAPQREFIYLKAKNAILDFFACITPYDEDTLALRLSSIIDLNSKVSITCAGAILTHINRQSMHSDGALPVTGIEVFSLEKIMFINKDALSSLQIMDDEDNAAIWKSRMDNYRQPKCLLHVLNWCITPSGKYLFKEWFQRPLADKNEINTRLDAVQACLSPDKQHLINQITQYMKGVKNVSRVVSKIRLGTVKAADFQILFRFCYAGIAIHGALVQMCKDESSSSMLEKIFTKIDLNSLKHIACRVNHIVDFDESDIEERIVVMQNVDVELDNMKRMYAGLDVLLSDIAQRVAWQFSNDESAALSSVSVVYFPQLGFLISVIVLQQDEKILEIPITWKFIFSDDITVYYKSEEMQALDEGLGDIYNLIIGRELEILQGFENEILSVCINICTAADALSELDCILSLARVAKMEKYVRPIIVDEKVIDLKQSRHPVFANRMENFVENDIEIGLEGKEVVIVVTGANYSGKSVYIKQAAVITFMAQLGSFVPANKAKIGIVDKIFTRVHTKESAGKNESAFMFDLEQVISALNQSTRKSLIILDEFGKGTKYWEGVALFCAIIEHFLNRGEDNCPRVLCATHFGEVLDDEEFQIKTPLIGYLYMSLIMNEKEKQGKIENDITYLYKAVKGKTKASLGIELAKKMGLFSTKILSRGMSVIEGFSSKSPFEWIEEERLKEDEWKIMEKVVYEVETWDVSVEHADSGVRNKLRRLLIGSPCCN